MKNKEKSIQKKFIKKLEKEVQEEVREILDDKEERVPEKKGILRKGMIEVIKQKRKKRKSKKI